MYKNKYLDEGFRLVWNDEFDYSGKVDSALWNYDIGHGHKGWGNRESQYYSDEAENCLVEDGKLVIQCSFDKKTETYYSSRINTYGKGSWTYGRFEIRAKLPSGAGTWPAIWMLSEDLKRGTSWPLCGEIDIMEHIGRDPEKIHFSLHCDEYNHKKKTQITGVHLMKGILEEFHTYRMDWDKEGFTFYIDDQQLSRFPRENRSGEHQWPFDKPYFLIVNLAAGGHWGGEIDNRSLPARFELEYIRVYQKDSIFMPI